MTSDELLSILLDSIDDFAEPEPPNGTRQWNSRYQTYHRGCVLFSGSISPDEWEKLKPLFASRFKLTEDTP